MIDKSQIAQWRAAIEKATPGPWSADSASDGDGCSWHDVLGDDVRITGDHLRKDDAEFIALSREALPLALDTIEEQGREIERLRAALETILKLEKEARSTLAPLSALSDAVDTARAALGKP